MTHGWRNLAVLLLVVCSWQTWRGCHRPSVAPGATDRAERAVRVEPARSSRAAAEADPPRPTPSPTAGPGRGPSIYGVRVPPWAMAMLPAPGEDLRDYRDRMLPLAQLAVAPQRARVARSRDQLVRLVGLDRAQQGELDAATRDAAQAIQDRLFNAVLSGEVAPASFKPMAGVAVARDVLDTIDRANKRFVATLTDAQRTQLAQHPFDFADHLLFSTRWEDAISGL
jgi:hypothetical protein